QLTDITSEITDEELLEFTSEYYIPLALQPVVPAANASIAEAAIGSYDRTHNGTCVGATKNENTAVLEPTPLRSVSDANVDPLERNVTCADYSEAAGITRAESKTEEVNSGLKRKRATSGDGAGSSKRVCHVILGDSASTKGEAMDASPTTAAKDVTETPPPSNVEAASNTSAPVTHVEQSPPKTSSFITDNLSQGGRETGPKVFEGMPVDQLMEEIDMVAVHQATLVAQLKARFSGECSRSVQKDEEIALLKAQLVDGVEEWLEKQEEKLRKLSIKYDEELYPHLVSSIAKRGWLISHGLRLAAMCTLESQEVKQSFGDVVKYALARGRAEAVEELHENKLLTVPTAQVPGYNKDAYKELVAAMEKMKLLELPHIMQLEHDQDYPIDVIMAGLAKKKGVKGKAILCGVGAAHLPRSDGVPVSVATMSLRDSDLLEKLKEARNAAYQVDSSKRGHSHSV
nr:transposase (putative), gypsy type [Tanacetum cinerariifolium]